MKPRAKAKAVRACPPPSRRNFLAEDEHVLAAYAEPCSGPGWTNLPIIALIWTRDGKIRRVWLQPGEQTADMQMLYRFSSLAHAQMTTAVKRAFRDNA